MLLDVVALSGNVRRDRLASRQAHTRRFSFARVGLLGPCDADFDAHALALRIFAFGQGGGGGVADSSIFTASLFFFFLSSVVCGEAATGPKSERAYPENLVQCRILGGC